MASEVRSNGLAILLAGAGYRNYTSPNANNTLTMMTETKPIEQWRSHVGQRSRWWSGSSL